MLASQVLRIKCKVLTAQQVPPLTGMQPGAGLPPRTHSHQLKAELPTPCPSHSFPQDTREQEELVTETHRSVYCTTRLPRA